MGLSEPKFSSSHEDCYKSFLQEFPSSQHNYGEDGQPTKTARAPGRCDICPNYSFTVTII